MNHIEYLKSLGACEEAIAFAINYPDLPSAYAACVRPDWLFWLAGRTDVTRQQIVLAACACARTALPYAEGPEALAAIETAEAWCRGDATIEQVRDAARAARAAYAAADATYAADAAYAAAYAARAAYAAYATYAAADAAYAADTAAAYAAYAVAAYADMCDLIRTIIPCPSPTTKDIACPC
jgi:hypothetical protein